VNAPNQWQLSRNAAERHERVLVPAIFAPWAADLVALADLRPGERVVDVACGPGVGARLAAERMGWWVRHRARVERARIRRHSSTS
jgi:hypothetical protein